MKAFAKSMVVILFVVVAATIMVTALTAEKAEAADAWNYGTVLYAGPGNDGRVQFMFSNKFQWFWTPAGTSTTEQNQMLAAALAAQAAGTNVYWWGDVVSGTEVRGIVAGTQ